MNRRQFTQRLAALCAAPVLPNAGIAAIANPANALTRPLHQYKCPYSWAAFTARTHGTISADSLQKLLGLSKEQASDAFTVLVREQVLGLPNAMGLSQALNPINKTHTELVKINTQQRLKQALEKQKRELLSNEHSDNPESESPAIDDPNVEVNANKQVVRKTDGDE